MDTQNQNNNSSPTWQERHITTDCKNCLFFLLKSANSRFGVCQCQESYFFQKDVFQDSGCAKFKSKYGG